MKLNINNPHDVYFKQAMSEHKVATEFFQQYLPHAIQAKIDFNSLELCKETFVDKQLNSSAADLLYRVNIDNASGYLYLLTEHQSYIDKMLALRIVEYVIRIIRTHITQFKVTTLPIVYPLIFYTGIQTYLAPVDFFKLFKDESLVRDIWNKPFQLINLNLEDDKDIENNLWTGMMKLIMKYSRHRDFLNKLKNIKIHSVLLDTEEGDNLLTISLQYMYEMSKDHINDEGLTTILTSSLPEIEEKVMTFAEELRQEGKKEGIKSEKHHIAKKLLEKGMPIKEISELTELPLNQIQQLVY